MASESEDQSLERFGTEIFELTQLSALARARSKAKDADNLSETEALTLDLLSKSETMTVGQIQKAIGVLPAQMSRIIRSLEDKGGKPYIACGINPNDRRKIDVSITATGKNALDTYRTARMAMTVHILASLSPKEREAFMQTLRKIRSHIESLVSQRIQKK